MFTIKFTRSNPDGVCSLMQSIAKSSSLVIVFILHQFTGTLTAKDNQMDTILAKIDAYRNYSGQEHSFSFKIDDIDKKNNVETSVMRVFVQDAKHVLCKYIQPENDKGKYVLLNNKNFWFFDRKMNAPIRISPRQMLMGEASSGDIARTVFSNLYSIDSTRLDNMIRMVYLSAIPGSNATYYHMVLKVEAKTSKPISALCYSKAGVPLKSIQYSSYEVLNGEEILVGFTVKNELNKRENLVSLYDFKEETLPKSHFNTQYMRFLD